MNVIFFILGVLAFILIVLLIRKYTSVEFVSHARLLFKAWSVWLTTAGTFLGVWLASAPENLLMAWNMLPSDLKSSLPVNFAQYVSYSLIALGLISQFIRQKKLVAQKENMEAADGHDRRSVQ